MKREDIGMILLAIFLTAYFVVDYLTEDGAGEYVHKFIVIWLMLAFYAGQYSMKFPKRF